MESLWKITTYGYLVIAAILLYTSYTEWTIQPQRSYMMLGLAVAAIIVFFIKRNFRKKVIARNKQNKKE